MKFNTHNLIDADLFYFGFDLNAKQTSGEYLGISIGNLYFGNFVIFLNAASGEI